MKQPQDHLRGKKQPMMTSTWIATDQDLADEYQEAAQAVQKAEYELGRMQQAKRPAEVIAEQELKIVQLNDALEETKTALRTNGAVKFVFKGLSPKKWDLLLAEHAPTDIQRARAKADGEDTLPFNPDTYPMAVIRACIVEPKMDGDELEEWLTDGSFNAAEIQELFGKAVGANQSRRILDLGKG